MAVAARPPLTCEINRAETLRFERDSRTLHVRRLNAVHRRARLLFAGVFGTVAVAALVAAAVVFWV